MTGPSLLDVALAHVSAGRPVFPLEPGGKRPLGRLASHGLKDATVDAGRVRWWWGKEPAANIGTPTGVSFDVLDVDGPDALAALDAALPLADNPDDDPVVLGPTVRTPRGWHVWVAPTGNGNTVNVGGLPGVDWRGTGGYVVAPGSVKVDGTAWIWALPDDPDCGMAAPIRPAPAWLLDHLARPPAPTAAPPRVWTGPPTASDRYGQAALERALGRLASATNGSRNHQLNTEAHGLGKLVAAGHLRGSEVAERLFAVACQIGLGEHEARLTIDSGLMAGLTA